MSDVIAAAIEVDGLSHEKLAKSIIANVNSLPPGSVVAIQAAWGRGKTDVLKRIARQYEGDVGSGASVNPLWLNPWQYGTPNLIAPLVTELLRRLDPDERSGNQRLKQATETLLRAGNAVAFKALSVFVPFGELASSGQAPVDDLIVRLFESDTPGESSDADPVAAMARRFRDLIGEYLEVSGLAGPVIICVDDLDRCLPDQQIALLEAVHFLTSADANAKFIVAIDPRLVQQAAVSHYSGSGFDVEQYLNKLFDLRVNLTALTGDLRRGFLDLALSSANGEPLNAGARLGLDEDGLADAWERVFLLPELSNPRLISRAVRRFELYLAADPDPLGPADPVAESELALKDRVDALVRLIAITERWPDLRMLVQLFSPRVLRERLEQFTRYYGVNPATLEPTAAATPNDGMPDAPWLFDRLPERKLHPDLGIFLGETLEVAGVEETFPAFDQKLLAAGL